MTVQIYLTTDYKFNCISLHCQKTPFAFCSSVLSVSVGKYISLLHCVTISLLIPYVSCKCNLMVRMHISYSFELCSTELLRFCFAFQHIFFYDHFINFKQFDLFSL